MSDQPPETSDEPSSMANAELHVFYYVGASISLAASIFVIFSYLKVAHPTSHNRASRVTRRTPHARHTLTHTANVTLSAVPPSILFSFLSL